MTKQALIDFIQGEGVYDQVRISRSGIVTAHTVGDPSRYSEKLNRGGRKLLGYDSELEAALIDAGIAPDPRGGLKSHEALVRRAVADGWGISVNDGGGSGPVSRDVQEILDAIHSVDDSKLLLRSEAGVIAVWIVLDSGDDTVNDYTDHRYMTQLEEEGIL